MITKDLYSSQIEQRKGYFSIETQEESSDWINDADVKEQLVQESIGEKKPDSEQNHNKIESLVSPTTSIDKQAVNSDVYRNPHIEGRTNEEENNLTEDNQEVYLTDAITGKGITLEEAKVNQLVNYCIQFHVPNWQFVKFATACCFNLTTFFYLWLKRIRLHCPLHLSNRIL